MKKTSYIIMSLTAASAILTACQGDDLSQYAQQSDQANEICFSLGSETVTRSSYKTTNPHPSTLGAYGYHDLTTSTFDKNVYNIFTNVEVTQDTEKGTWSYANTKYWADYSSCNTFDFYGYMPYSASASLTLDDKKYNLTFPFTMPSDDPIISENNLACAPLICNIPVHRTYPGDIVSFNMDQTLTGFQLQFELGADMDAVRDFKIKGVKVYGSMPISGTVKREYTYTTNSGWQSSDIKWSGVTTNNKYTKEYPYIIYNKDTNGENQVLTVNSKSFKSWGSPFFVIPSNQFTPTMEVTYDVYVDGTETPTRENVTNTINFNWHNFASYNVGTPGKINNIQIKIVPSHIYVLADDDQTIGYLVIE